MVVYVNWYNETIYTEKEFPNAIEQKFNDVLNDSDEKNEELRRFLRYKKDYNVAEVFNLSATEKEEIWSEFLTYLHSAIEENMKEDFERYKLE